MLLLQCGMPAYKGLDEADIFVMSTQYKFRDCIAGCASECLRMTDVPEAGWGYSSGAW